VNWFKHRNYWSVAGVILILPMMAQAQTSVGSITLKANVRETVALSVSPNFLQDNVQVNGHNDVKSLMLTLSGSANDVVSFRVPILIRSNTWYKISGLVQSQTATLSNLAVLDAYPTGRFVARDGFANLTVAQELDRRNKNGIVQVASIPLNLSSPLRILSGPRVSLAGTLNSADNALEVILFIVVKPDAGSDGWFLHLTLSGSAGDGF
jgi:hypothetical protein